MAQLDRESLNRLTTLGLGVLISIVILGGSVAYFTVARRDRHPSANPAANRASRDEENEALAPIELRAGTDTELTAALVSLLKQQRENTRIEDDTFANQLRAFARLHPRLMVEFILNGPDADARRLAMAVFISVSKDGELILHVLKRTNDLNVERMAIGALAALRYIEAWDEIEGRVMSQAADGRVRIEGMDALFAIDRTRLSLFSLSTMVSAGLGGKYIELLAPGATNEFASAVLEMWRAELEARNEQVADNLCDQLMRMPTATIFSFSEGFLLSERNQTIRNRFVFGLSDAPEEISLSILGRLASVPSDPEDRLQAIYALRQIGTEAAISVLLKALAPTDSDTFGMQILQLSEKGLEQFPSLRTLLRGPAREAESSVLRIAVLSEWCRFGGALAEVGTPADSVKVAREVLTSTGSSSIAAFAARVLCAADASSLVSGDDLLLALSRTDQMLDGRFETFSSICERPSISGLRRWSTEKIRSTNKKDSLMEFAAIYICRKGDSLDRSECAPDLQNLLKDPDLGIRIAWLAKKMGDAETLSRLRELLTDETPYKIREELE